MNIKFDEAKTAQAAAYLIKKRGQGYMSYMKLIKLLYLADREALVKWGRPITFDRFVAMPHGMVLSNTLELITGESDSDIWNSTFHSFGEHELKLINSSIDTGKLSKAEIRLLDEIFNKFGNQNRWQLRDFSHTLPEWVDPQGSSIPVDISDILKFERKTSAEIETIKNELESSSLVSSLFGNK